MGNKFSRKRDETAAEETAAAQPAEESVKPCTQEAVETKNLDGVVGECVTQLACKGVEAVACYAGLNDAEPAPAQPKLLDSISEPSPPEPVAEPKPAAEALISLDPEPAPQEEPLSDPQVEEVEAVLEPTSELPPVPTEALEQPTDMLTEFSAELEPISAPLIDLAVPDVTLQPVDTPPSPTPTPEPVDEDEPADIPESEQYPDTAEICTFELEKSESLEEPAEVEATENLEQLVSHVEEESISGLLHKLDLKGNDLIPIDVTMPDVPPITDISLSAKLI